MRSWPANAWLGARVFREFSVNDPVLTRLQRPASVLMAVALSAVLGLAAARTVSLHAYDAAARIPTIASIGAIQSVFTWLLAGALLMLGMGAIWFARATDSPTVRRWAMFAAFSVVIVMICQLAPELGGWGGTWVSWTQALLWAGAVYAAAAIAHNASVRSPAIRLLYAALACQLAVLAASEAKLYSSAGGDAATWLMTANDSLVLVHVLLWLYLTLHQLGVFPQRSGSLPRAEIRGSDPVRWLAYGQALALCVFAVVVLTAAAWASRQIAGPVTVDRILVMGTLYFATGMLLMWRLGTRRVHTTLVAFACLAAFGAGKLVLDRTAARPPSKEECHQQAGELQAWLGLVLDAFRFSRFLWVPDTYDLVTLGQGEPVQHQPVVMLDATGIVFQGEQIAPGSLDELGEAMQRELARFDEAVKGFPRLANEVNRGSYALVVDAETAWALVVDTVNTAAAAGKTEPSFVFEIPAPVQRPRSSLDPELDEIFARSQAGIDASSVTKLLADLVSREIARCPSLIELYGRLATADGDDREKIARNSTAAALEQCHCRLDMARYKSMLFALYGAFRYYGAVTAVIADGASNQLAFPGSTRWKTTGPTVAQAVRGRGLPLKLVATAD